MRGAAEENDRDKYMSDTLALSLMAARDRDLSPPGPRTEHAWGPANSTEVILQAAGVGKLSDMTPEAWERVNQAQSYYKSERYETDPPGPVSEAEARLASAIEELNNMSTAVGDGISG